MKRYLPITSVFLVFILMAFVLVKIYDKGKDQKPLRYADVPQETIDSELRVAVEKTKEEQIAKAVEAAIRKAGVNPAHVDSEDHIESNMAKGWITPEQAQMVREIKEKVAAEKAANMPEQMIQNIAQGRLKKFFKENCLLEQEFIWDKNQTVAQYLHSVDKELTIVAFKRFTLRAE